MGLTTCDKIVFVESRRGATEIESYESRLDLVLRLMDSGTIGEGSTAYGSAEHLAALLHIECQLASVREKIAKFNAREIPPAEYHESQEAIAAPDVVTARQQEEARANARLPSGA